jgi:hypothetical protein
VRFSASPELTFFILLRVGNERSRIGFVPSPYKIRWVQSSGLCESRTLIVALSGDSKQPPGLRAYSRQFFVSLLQFFVSLSKVCKTLGKRINPTIACFVSDSELAHIESKGSSIGTFGFWKRSLFDVGSLTDWTWFVLTNLFPGEEIGQVWAR